MLFSAIAASICTRFKDAKLQLSRGAFAVHLDDDDDPEQHYDEAEWWLAVAADRLKSVGILRHDQIDQRTHRLKRV